MFIFVPTALSMAGSICVNSVSRVRPPPASSTTFAARMISPRAYASVTGLKGWVVARFTMHRAPLFTLVKWHRVTKSRALKGPQAFVALQDTLVWSSRRWTSSHLSQNSLKSLARFASLNNSYTVSQGASIMPLASTHACLLPSVLFHTFVRASFSEITVHMGSVSSSNASTVATAAALSLLKFFGGGVGVASSFESRFILRLRGAVSFAARRVRPRGAAWTVVVANRSSAALRRMLPQYKLAQVWPHYIPVTMLMQLLQDGGRRIL